MLSDSVRHTLRISLRRCTMLCPALPPGRSPHMHVHGQASSTPYALPNSMCPSSSPINPAACRLVTSRNSSCISKLSSLSQSCSLSHPACPSSHPHVSRSCSRGVHLCSQSTCLPSSNRVALSTVACSASRSKQPPHVSCSPVRHFVSSSLASPKLPSTVTAAVADAVLGQAGSTQVKSMSDQEQRKSDTTDQAGPSLRLQRLKINFCRQCGQPMQLSIPPGEGEFRHVCGGSSGCGYVDYVNPKMVVGAVIEHEGQILLCRRAIEPCKGLWTIPAGYMELDESSAAGAQRETWEEAMARIEIIAPYAHWDIPAIGQAYVIFRARLAAPFTFSPGPESLETKLFAPSAIPFDQIAFSSIGVTLRQYLKELEAGNGFSVHHGEIDKAPGAAANDPSSFQVVQHMSSAVGP